MDIKKALDKLGIEMDVRYIYSIKENEVWRYRPGDGGEKVVTLADWPGYEQPKSSSPTSKTQTKKKIAKKKIAKKNFLNLSNIKDRGWTDTMIRKLLGEPDRTKKNLYYRGGPPIKHYEEDRVAAAENTIEYMKLFELASRRSSAMKKVAARKEAELIVEIEKMEIVVRRPKDLLAEAIQNYNDLPQSVLDNKYATEKSDPLFLRRIVVNYLRHCCTSYDQNLWEHSGKTGVVEARDVFRERIYKAIASNYPEYIEECACQLKRRGQFDSMDQLREKIAEKHED